MKISYDLLGAQSEAYYNRGIGRYTKALALEIKRLLQKQGESVKFLAHANFKEVVPELKRELAVERLQLIHAGENLGEYGSYKRVIGGKLALDAYNATDSDVIIFSSLFEGFSGKGVLPESFSELNAFSVAVLYDLIPYIFPDQYLRDAAVKSWYDSCLKRVKSCDLLLAISESTRQDAIRYLGIEPEKIVNIGAAVSDLFCERKCDREALKKQFNIKDNYVLYTGGMDWRKNIDGLIRGWSYVSKEIRRNHQLVLVCNISQSEKQRLLMVARQFALTAEDIIFTGYVSDDDLVSLYNEASLFVFPSLYEGFGLPVIEAMRCGTPVIGANNSSIKEIIRKKEALFDADSPSNMAEVIEKSLQDDELRKELKKSARESVAEYTWANSAQKTLTAIREKYRQKYVGVPKKCKKIAWISPVSPAQSGIAAYSDELLPHIATDYEIDIYTDVLPKENMWTDCKIGVFSWRELPANVNKYDLMVYHFGNSEYHTYMHYLFLRYPGLVVLHDFYLGGMLSWYAAREKDHHSLVMDEIYYSHGWRGVHDLMSNDVGYVAWEWPMNKRILDNAYGLIFHSKFSLELCKQFYGEKYAEKLSTAVVPMIVLRKRDIEQNKGKDKAVLRGKYGFDADDFIIASFGYIGPTKQTELIVKAMRQAEKESAGRSIKLVLAGNLSPGEYSDELHKLIKELKYPQNVVITGYLDDKKYLEYMRLADVAVQLRTKSRGETSAVIPECMMMELPVILNGYASFDDYPGEVVYKMPEQVTAANVAEAIMKMYVDDELRKGQAARANAYIREQHNEKHIATLYAEQIEKAMSVVNKNCKDSFIDEIGSVLTDSSSLRQDCMEVAQCYEANHRRYNRQNVYFLNTEDISIADYENNNSNPLIDLVAIEWDEKQKSFKLKDNAVHITLTENDIVLSDSYCIPTTAMDNIVEHLAGWYCVIGHKTEKMPVEVEKYLSGQINYRLLDSFLESVSGGA